MVALEATEWYKGAVMLTLCAAGLENNREYKFDWDITYNYDGMAQNESGDIIKTITYEPTVVAKAVLQDNSSTQADVTVTNLTGSILSGNYVYVNGYGEDGEIIAITGTALDNLDAMATSELTLTLDKPVYSVFAYVEDEESTVPTSLAIKKNGVDASNIVVDTPSTHQYTAEVFDSLGNSLSSENVVWSVSPSGQGINVKNGTVTIVENTPAGRYIITASAGGTAYDEVVITIEDFTPQSKLIYSGLTKSGDMITGGLTLQIVNDNPQLSSCNIIIAVYEKGENKLATLKKFKVSLNLGANIIELNDLSFFVDPTKTYEVRIFSWRSVNTLMRITSVFKKDI